MGVLDGKVAIVTGSARGIGRATAELLSAHGARLAINDLDAGLVAQTAAEIDGETVVFAGDLTKPGVPDELVQTVIDAWGQVDILVNNAGYTLDAPLHKMSDDWANYSSGKAAVVGLTRTLAKEWGQFKINVNAVAFGFIETRLTASKEESNVMEIEGETIQLGMPDRFRGASAMLIPLGRPGTPEEAAGGIFFLCSPWSNYVHGQVLGVTGGQLGGMTT